VVGCEGDQWSEAHGCYNTEHPNPVLCEGVMQRVMQRAVRLRVMQPKRDLLDPVTFRPYKHGIAARTILLVVTVSISRI
jgi:hypothetical protein